MSAHRAVTGATKGGLPSQPQLRGVGYGAVCFQHPTPEHLLPVLPRTSADPLSERQ